MKRLFIVRHGRTFGAGEPSRRIGARTDLPLVAEGRKEGAALGAAFANRGIVFDTALTGPLSRTWETATAILHQQIAPPALQVRTWLTEIDHGVDENQFEDAVIDRVGVAALLAWEERGVGPPGWQTNAERRIDAWRVLFDDKSDGTTLVVTSNGSARFAAIALGLEPRPSFKLGTGCYAEFVYRDDAWHIAAWNIRP